MDDRLVYKKDAYKWNNFMVKFRTANCDAVIIASIVGLLQVMQLKYMHALTFDHC